MFSFLLVAVLFNANAQAEDQFSKDIQKYLSLTGTKEVFPVMIDQMINQMKGGFKEVPEEYWGELKIELKGSSIDELFDKMIPIYKKHFTHDDIKKIIEFYESPVGKKMALATPKLTQESMSVAQEWGQALGQKIVKKLNEKGYKM